MHESHPFLRLASSSHIAVPKGIREQNGITDGLARVSGEIENVGDLKGAIA